MKKSCIWLLILSMLVISGCVSATKHFSIDAYGISLKMPEDWAAVEDSTFDLQLSNGTAYMSLMAYRRDEVDMSTSEIQRWHDDALLGSREGVRVIEDERSEEIDGKTVQTMVYGYTLDDTENYYYSTITALNDTTFVWLVVTAPMKDLDEDRDMIRAMLVSLSAD